MIGGSLMPFSLVFSRRSRWSIRVRAGCHGGSPTAHPGIAGSMGKVQSGAPGQAAALMAWQAVAWELVAHAGMAMPTLPPALPWPPAHPPVLLPQCHQCWRGHHR